MANASIAFEGAAADAHGVTANDGSPAGVTQRAFRAVLAFVQHAARGTTPPATLRACLLRRSHRALSRAIGLSAYAELLDSLTGMPECQQVRLHVAALPLCARAIRLATMVVVALTASTLWFVHHTAGHPPIVSPRAGFEPGAITYRGAGTGRHVHGRVAHHGRQASRC